MHYQCVIHVGIWVACSLYKLTHSAELLQCSELFAIGKSIVHLVLQKFVFVVNIVFKNKIMCLKRKELVEVRTKFKSFYGLPLVHRTIDVTQIHVQKP